LKNLLGQIGREDLEEVARLFCAIRQDVGVLARGDRPLCVWVTEGATKGASEQGYRVLIPECTKVSQNKGEKKGESKTQQR